MIRWTTPTFVVRLRDAGEVDLTAPNVSNVYFTITTKTVTITKTGEDLEIKPQEVDAFLSQDESGRLPEGDADIQLNWTYDVPGESGSPRRAATVIKKIRIDKNLLREVVE